jgi:hypothetical protein
MVFQIALGGLLVGGVLLGQDICSLRVAVVTFGSTREVKVVVQETNDRRVELITKSGIAEFCNLGINPVSVVVGDAGCAQVVVHRVPLAFGESRKLTVGYDDSLCNQETAPVAACSFVIRVVDISGNPIPGVGFQPSDRRERPLIADKYARFIARVAAGTELSGEIKAQGFEIKPIRALCTSEAYRTEMFVTLNRLKQ